MATFKSNTSREYYAILTVTEKSQSIEANKTTLSYKLVMYSGDYDFSGYTIGYQIKINGKEVAYHDNNGNQTSLGTNSSKTVCSGTTTVTHDSDGTKEDMAISFKIWMDKTSYLPASDLTKSGTMDLTTIPRATAPSIDLDSVEMGKSIVISMPRKVSSFTHTLTYSFGEASGTIGTELGTSKTWTVPLSLADKIPNATSGTLTVTCKTYSGSTLIGTKTDAVKVIVPDTVVPNINDVDITEAVAAVTNAFGDIFVQNLSQLNVAVEASGAYGSTIKSYSVELDGITYVRQAFTSNVIRTAGELDIIVNVTDSRGRKVSETYKVDIVEYSKPVVTNMTYIRCDSDGTQNSSGMSIKVTVSGKVYPVNELNTKALKLLYKATTEEVYTERVITVADWEFSVDVIINNTDPSVTYECVVQLSDKINAGNPVTHRITTGIIAFSRRAGGKGITFFGEAEEDGIVVKGNNPLKFTDPEAIEQTKKNLGLDNADGLIVDDAISEESGNPVQNKVVKAYVDTSISRVPHNYLPLSGGTVAGNVAATGNLTVDGSVLFKTFFKVGENGGFGVMAANGICWAKEFTLTSYDGSLTSDTFLSRASDNAFLVGNGNYATKILGSGTRPAYNNDSLALYSDLSSYALAGHNHDSVYATKTELNKKANDFSIEIYNGTSGNPKPVRFASFNYSTCNSENGIAAKISMVSGHGNGSSYAFLQDAIIKVTHTGGVEVDNFKYYGASAGTYDDANRQYGDIFWLVDTTNKIVDFYVLMGQYARLYQTPWKRLTYSTGGTVTQHTSCTVYSSGEKAWANNSEIALVSDLSGIGGVSGDYLPLSGGTITGNLIIGSGIAMNAIMGTINTKGVIVSDTGRLALSSDSDEAINLGNTSEPLVINGSTKTFTAPSNVTGTEQITAKFKTSNGGSISFGKEAANSGSMLRFDQVDGTCRLRFRGSATAGAIVWEQPEQGAQLYIDLGSSGADYRRITFPSSGGTLALTSQLSGYLPTSGGTLTGHLYGQYIVGTWLQTTAATDMGAKAEKIAVINSNGWIYYRTPAEILSDIGAAASGHNHDSVYAKTASANTYNGEQKFQNSSYCPTVTDTASGVGCAFKASRGLANEMLVDKLIMTASTGKIPFYNYTSTSGGQMTGLTEVASIGNGDLTLTPTTGEGGQIVLNAAADDSTHGGTVIDNCVDNLRIFGLPSRDGTTHTGVGSVLVINPFNASITGGYSFDGSKLTMTSGAKITGRYVGGGDDEGLIIGRASNSYAGLCLGEPSGVRSVMYLMPNNSAVWRYNDGSSSYDIKHPGKAGTIALISDITDAGVGSGDLYLPLSGGTITGVLTVTGTTISQGNFFVGTENKFLVNAYTGVCYASSYESSSDRRAKSNIMSISDYPTQYTADGEANIFDRLFSKLKPTTYTLNAKETNDLHIGFIAQEVEDALVELGCSSEDFALVGHRYWTDMNTGAQMDAYSLSYEQFTALNTYMIQKEQSRRKVIENEIRSLKAELISTQKKLDVAMMKIAEQAGEIDKLKIA